MELVERQQNENVEKFNNERRNSNSAKDYMDVYLQILQFAKKYNYINNAQKNSISHNLLEAVRDAADNNKIIMSNYFYIIAMRFNRLNNFEYLNLMSKIESFEDARFFIDDLEKWFFERIRNDIAIVREWHERSFELKNMLIVSTWYDLLEVLENIERCLLDGTDVDLKKLHYLPINMKYRTIQCEEGETFLDRIENYIKKFRIENKIIIKINSRKVVKKKILYRMRFVYNDESPEVVLAVQRFNKAYSDLEKITRVYEEMRKRFEKSDELHDCEHKTFIEENPNMTKLEIEDEFQKKWEDDQSFQQEDRWRIEREYCYKKEKCRSKFKICQKNLDNARDRQRFFETNYGKKYDNATLFDLLTEYALIILPAKSKLNIQIQLLEKIKLSNHYLEVKY